MAWCETCSTGVTSLSCAANSRRSGIGSDSTYWRTSTRGSEPGNEQSGGLFVPGERPGGNARAWSTGWAAVWAMRLAPQDGQKPRRLQLQATSLSWPQSLPRSRRKPWARMPRSTEASNSSFTNCGSSAPAAASACSKQVAACCCTKRYSVVCSGRWHSQRTGAPSGSRQGCRLTACTRSSRGFDLRRTEAPRCASIALCAAYLCMPTAAGTPSVALMPMRPAASRRRPRKR